MAEYQIAIPESLKPAVSEDTPAALAEFLTARGITVAAVTVLARPGGEPYAVRIDATSDPRPALAGFTPDRVSARKGQLLAGISLLLQYAAAVEAGQAVTAAQTVQAVRLLVRVLAELLQDDPRIRELLA